MAEAIILEGMNDLLSALTLNKEKASIAARNIVSKGGNIIRETARQEFRAQSDPRDMPPNPPNPTNRTMTLHNSIRAPRIRSLGEGRWQSDTRAAAPYAPFVEYGTSRSREFPFMELGIIDSADRIKDLAEREWAEARV